jgi:hypothetical protein
MRPSSVWERSGSTDWTISAFGGALMAVGGRLPYLLGGIVPAYRFISD